MFCLQPMATTPPPPPPRQFFIRDRRIFPDQLPSGPMRFIFFLFFSVARWGQGTTTTATNRPSRVRVSSLNFISRRRLATIFICKQRFKFHVGYFDTASPSCKHRAMSKIVTHTRFRPPHCRHRRRRRSVASASIKFHSPVSARAEDPDLPETTKKGRYEVRTRRCVRARRKRPREKEREKNVYARQRDF